MHPPQTKQTRHAAGGTFLSRSMHPMRAHRTQRGVSLVELMVAIGIGAFLLLGLVEIFSSARASYDLQQGLARLQEKTRFAENYIARNIRMAGAYPIAETAEPGDRVDLGAVEDLLPEDIPPVIGTGTTEGGGTSSDTLVINTLTDRDCFAQLNSNTDPDGRPAIWHKRVQFTVANDALRVTCQYGQPAAPPVLTTQINNQPLLNDVETLQVLLGEDIISPGDPDDSVDRYVTADSLTPGNRVVAVRIGLIMSTGEIGTLPPDADAIDLFGQSFAATGDNELRRPMVLNISLRNQAL